MTTRFELLRGFHLRSPATPNIPCENAAQPGCLLRQETRLTYETVQNCKPICEQLLPSGKHQTLLAALSAGQPPPARVHACR